MFVSTRISLVTKSNFPEGPFVAAIVDKVPAAFWVFDIEATSSSSSNLGSVVQSKSRLSVSNACSILRDIYQFIEGNITAYDLDETLMATIGFVDGTWIDIEVPHAVITSWFKNIATELILES